jgi:hypothetical protein
MAQFRKDTHVYLPQENTTFVLAIAGVGASDTVLGAIDWEEIS